jgi:hypothetical protein
MPQEWPSCRNPSSTGAPLVTELKGRRHFRAATCRAQNSLGLQNRRSASPGPQRLSQISLSGASKVWFQRRNTASVAKLRLKTRSQRMSATRRGRLSWRPNSPRNLAQFAIDPQLGSPHCQKLKFRCRLAGFYLVADLELPFPNTGSCRWHNRVFHAPVSHASPPSATPSRYSQPKREYTLCLFRVAHSSN